MNRLFSTLFYCTLLFTFLSRLSTDERFFLSSQERKDIKNFLLKKLKKERGEILLSIYALTDPDLIKALNTQISNDNSVSIWTEAKHLPSLKKKLNEKVRLIQRPQKGLMHHKILLIGSHCFLGSANLTSTSLRMHDNLMIDIYSPPLSFALKKMLLQYPIGSKFVSPTLTLYLLPHYEALSEVLSAIENAEFEIQVCFFTFTHPQIANALIEAHKRGVQIKVLIDALSSQGASSKTAQYLKAHGISLYVNRGTQLMHHKICFIDRKKFIFGSCNWTKSAFKKNNDFIACLKQLSDKEKKWIESLFRHLFWESTAYCN